MCLEFCTNDEERLVTTMNVALERAKIPVVGGTIFGYPAGATGYAMLDGELYPDACCYALIKNKSGKIRTYSENIFGPMECGKTHIATKVNLANKELISLDGRPAADVYCEDAGVSRSELVDNVLVSPLGRVIGDEIFISSPYAIGNNGSLINYKKINENDTIEILELKDYEAIGDETRNQIRKENGKISFIFSVNCIYRHLLFNQRNYMTDFLTSMKSVGPHVGIVGGALASAGNTFWNPGGDSDAVSGFLGALLAGFVAGWLLKMLEKACDHLPRALEGLKPILIYPLAGLGIVGVMMCAVNPVMGIINKGLVDGVTYMAEKPALLVPVCALMAAMMAIDMGGPFNKAAYVTATTLLSSGTQASYKVMAAVMIGGMVPPLVIALSTTIFKKRWTLAERKSGPVNFVMGISFITEGAIPYAASHPLQVIPSCMVGSACAGALSGLWSCTLMAPHGGIFVLPTIGNPALYFLALAIGAVVGTALLTLLKKPVKE